MPNEISGRLNPILFSLFFLSGFCSLLYQLVWVRIAFAHFGVITPVLSVVLSVFMLGLGVGLVLGGAWAQSLSERYRVSQHFSMAVLSCSSASGRSSSRCCSRPAMI